MSDTDKQGNTAGAKQTNEHHGIIMRGFPLVQRMSGQSMRCACKAPAIKAREALKH